MRWLILLIITTALSLSIGCGDAPGDAPILPPPMVWTGSIAFVGNVEIDGSSVRPDSINVILDGDTLGLLLNPSTIEDVAEGRHTIATYYRSAELITYTSPQKDIQVSYNRPSAVSIRLTRADLRGLIQIQAATIDRQVIDSVAVILDGTDLGWGENPRLIADVTEGIHKLTVKADIDDTEWEGWVRGIPVSSDETTTIEPIMVEVAPLEGYHAPDLVVTDLDGERHILSDHWGEVIYLYFFEHT